MPNKKLTRSPHKMLTGVCAGIGEYFDVDPTIVRIVWVFLSAFSTVFPGLLAYIIATIIIPLRSES